MQNKFVDRLSSRVVFTLLLLFAFIPIREHYVITPDFVLRQNRLRLDPPGHCGSNKKFIKKTTIRFHKIIITLRVATYSMTSANAPRGKQGAIETNESSQFNSSQFNSNIRVRRGVISSQLCDVTLPLGRFQFFQILYEVKQVQECR